MRELTAYSLAVRNSAQRYRVNPDGSRSAAGKQLFAADKPRIGFSILRFLLGDRLDLAETRQSIRSAGSAYENKWHGLLPEGGFKGVLSPTYLLNRVYGLAGGYYLPNAVKLIPDHVRIFGYSAQLLKRNYGIKAAHAVGSLVPLLGLPSLVTAADEAIEWAWGEDTWQADWLNPANAITTSFGTAWNVTGGWLFPTNSEGWFAGSQQDDSVQTGPTVAAAQAAASASTPGAEADPNLVTTNEYIMIGVWLEDTGRSALNLPDNWMSGEDEVYINRIHMRAAHLLKTKASDFPAWSLNPAENDFSAVWGKAREEINDEIRKEYIGASLISALSELTSGQVSEANRTQLRTWLENNPNIASIDPNTMLVSNPWDDDRAGFTAHVNRLFTSQGPNALQARIEAAKKLYADKRGVGVNELTAVELLASQTIAGMINPNNTDYYIFVKPDANGGPLMNGTTPEVDASLIPDTLLTQTLDIARQEVERAQRISAARMGLNSWMIENTPAEFTELKDQAQFDVELDAAEILAANTALSLDDLRNPAALSAERAAALTQAITAYKAADINQDGVVDERDRPPESGDDGPDTGPDANMGVTWDETKQAAANWLNWATDIDGDGYSVFMDTDFGRTISGGAQAFFGVIGDGVSDLSKTQEGKNAMAIGGAAIAALIAPSILKNFPVFKQISQIPVIGGLLIAGMTFFFAARLGTNLANDRGLFGGQAGADDNSGGEDDDGRTDDAQGSGGHIPLQRGHGFQVRVQRNGDVVPEIITIEVDDLDGDGIKDTLNFLDTDGDDEFAAQLVLSDGSKSFVAADFITREQLTQGGLTMTPTPSNGEFVKNGTLGTTINVTAVSNAGTTGQPTQFQLTGATAQPLVFENEVQGGLIDKNNVGTLPQ